MSTAAYRTVLDGFTSLEGGVNSGLSPSIIEPNQLSWAVNATVRDAFIKCRPGFQSLGLTFESAECRTLFEGGNFQGASYHDPGLLVVMVSGRMFVINIQDRAVQCLLNDGQSKTSGKVWMVQAERWTIIQDGTSTPIIFDGGSVRRAVLKQKEVPTGTCMAYTNGRLWVALPDGKSFVAGDLVYSSSGTPGNNRLDAVLKFTENEYIAEGGSFSVAEGTITAIKPLGVVDTSLGQGPLQVFTDKAIYSINVPADRTVWQSLTTPIQTISMLQYGATGQDSTVAVNGDLYYRSPDGIRSFVAARRDFATPGNTPISREVSRLLQLETTYHLLNGSGVFFDNRLLMTVSPRAQSGSTYWKGLLSLNFDLISSMRGKSAPAWEGVWTGLDIYQILTGEERCFVFANGCSGTIELWELSRNEPFDGTDTKIQWSFETRSMAFAGDGPFSRKRLVNADVWYDELRDRANLTVQYRRDQEPLWYDWTSWSEHAVDCMDFSSCTYCPALPQYRSKYRLRKPPENCSAVNLEPTTEGFEFQLRVAVQGHLRIRRLLVMAEQIHEPRIS